MNYIVSKKYKTGEIVNGKKAYNNLQECFNNVEEGAYIFLCSEEYYGKITLRQKNITLIGTDESTIVYDAYHSQKIRPEDGGNGEKVYGTTGSATFTVKEQASGFRMSNVTVINSHKTMNDASNQAVAFKTESTNCYFEECKFYGLQDTLYVDHNDNIFMKCYITGSVDFIFGKGDAIFDHCIMNLRSKTENYSYLVAPSTRVCNSYGFLFYKCVVTTEGNNPQYLGRPWYDRGTKEPIMPRAMFYECSFPDKISPIFIKMKDADPDKHECNFYKCKYKGEEISSTDDMRLVDFYYKIYSQRR